MTDIKNCPFCGENMQTADFENVRWTNKECFLYYYDVPEKTWNNRPIEDHLREIIKQKDEALEFYANSLYYKTKFNEESNSEELLYTELFDDMGELAQQALNIGDKE